MFLHATVFYIASMTAFLVKLSVRLYICCHLHPDCCFGTDFCPIFPAVQLPHLATSSRQEASRSVAQGPIVRTG